MASRRSTHSTRHRARPDPLARTVGQRIKTLRKERDWTFDAFVEEVGLGRGYVSELERGLVVPGLAALDRIARALELSIADLVVGETPREEIFTLMRDLPDEAIAELRAHARKLARTGREP